MTYRHFAIHPRHHRRPPRVRRFAVPPWVGGVTAALCMGVHALAAGYALVVRVRVEVVPAVAAPARGSVAPCGAALCGTAVIRG